MTKQTELLHLYKDAVEQARDVCKYLDHDMVDKAKANTVYFWDVLNQIKEYEDVYYPDTPN